MDRFPEFYALFLQSCQQHTLIPFVAARYHKITISTLLIVEYNEQVQLLTALNKIH
jgi:hypothetical protein